MTAAFHARILIAMLCLPALATSASGEGAWTMWMMGSSSPWDSVGTFPTREQCMEALHQQAQAVEKLGLKVTENGPGASFAGSSRPTAVPELLAVLDAFTQEHRRGCELSNKL